MTYPALMGLDGARGAVVERTEKAKAALASAFPESEWMKILMQFADYVRDMAK